ncbi:hypothetical protein [Streptomyces sp. 3N207]|uniref:hypothetical protein n=1 Tax=Streptomyces sp. 3N207 TaxID=3457417 RepID=UPI003FD489DF
MTTNSLADALRRDRAALLEAYDSGLWAPRSAERELAEDLARSPWNGTVFRASLRHLPPTVRSGRLIEVLAPAAEVLDQADVDQELVLRLRVLLDTLSPTA